MIQFLSRLSFPSHVSLYAQLILCLAAITGCSLGPSDADGSPDESEDLAVSEEALGTGPWSSNPDLVFAAKNGFDGFMLMGSCVSKKAGAATITTAPLPVGGGRRIECTTVRGDVYRSWAVPSTDPIVLWCMRGELDSAKAKQHPLAVVTITSKPRVGPWTVAVTRAGGEVLIDKASLLGGQAWPFMLLLHYRTTAMRKDDLTKSCQQQLP